MVSSLSPDAVAAAFNADFRASGWQARPSPRQRINGIFNAVSYSYRGGLVRIVMDCDKEIGDSFLIKFERHTASFGDYLAAIQRALYRVLKSLRTHQLAELPVIEAFTDVEFSLRKDGAEYRLRWIRDVANLSRGDDYPQETTEIDDLL